MPRAIAAISKADERRIANEHFRNKVINITDKLFAAQASLALGVQYLYRVNVRLGVGGEQIRSRPCLVSDTLEIEEYIQGKYNKLEKEYYFIATDKPDGKAIDSLLDRAIGKAQGVEEDREDIAELGVIAYPVTDAPEVEQTDGNILLDADTRGLEGYVSEPPEFDMEEGGGTL